MNQLVKIRNFFTRTFDLKTQILLRVALIGVVIGIVAVAFRKATEILGTNLCGRFFNPHEWYEYFYLPLIGLGGGLLVGFLTQTFAPDAGGSGIPQVKKAINLNGAAIRLRTAVVKFFGGIIGLASGLSLGREGPTIQIAAGLASKISRALGGKHRKRAIASGAGAGLAAAFNTPIAGVIFVIEELDRNMSSVALGPAIVCSVSAAVTCRLLYGNFFAVHFSSSHVTNLYEMPFYIGLGVIAGISGAFFQRSIIWGLNFYRNKLNKMPRWSWPGIAGLITGLVGNYLPQALGGGHNALEWILADETSLTVVLIIIIFAAKYFLTVIAYGSNAPGGIFAPALILGALLGSAVGHLPLLFFSDYSISPANFAFVGMGAFFTAISRAPITSIVMLFELTGNYMLVLPLMFACIVANITAEKFKKGSIYRNLLEHDGIDIKEYSSPSYLQRFSVEDSMTSKVKCLNKNTTIEELGHIFETSDHSGYPVVDDDNKLTGIVTKEDMLKCQENNYGGDLPISEIMSKNLKVIRPTDSLNTAILQLYEFKIGRLPVVDENDCNKIIGIITRSDIINFEANQELAY